MIKLNCFYNFLILFTIVFLISGFCKNTEAGETITLSQYEIEPFMEKRLPGGGPFIQFITGLFKSMGHEVKIEWFPHKRAYINVKRGSMDCSVGWNKLREREKEVFFSDVILFESVYLYHLKETDVEWNSIADLKKHKIGIKLGAAIYGDDFFKAARENIITIDSALTDLHNLKKLLSGRIDIVPLSLANASYYLKTSFTKEEIDRITYHPKPFLKSSFHVIFSLKNKSLMENFNKAFEKAGGRKLFMERLQQLNKAVGNKKQAL